MKKATISIIPRHSDDSGDLEIHIPDGWTRIYRGRVQENDMYYNYGKEKFVYMKNFESCQFYTSVADYTIVIRKDKE